MDIASIMDYEGPFYGWECPRCGAVYSPHVEECWRCCTYADDEPDDGGEFDTPLPTDISASDDHICVVYDLESWGRAKPKKVA